MKQKKRNRGDTKKTHYLPRNALMELISSFTIIQEMVKLENDEDEELITDDDAPAIENVAQPDAERASPLRKLKSASFHEDPTLLSAAQLLQDEHRYAYTCALSRHACV